MDDFILLLPDFLTSVVDCVERIHIPQEGQKGWSKSNFKQALTGCHSGPKALVAEGFVGDLVWLVVLCRESHHLFVFFQTKVKLDQKSTQSHKTSR